MAEFDGLIQLDEFVAATLTQILSGVFSAQEQIDDTGAKINPVGIVMTSDRGGFIGTENEKLIPEWIEFDIAVTASESAKKEGKVGANVAVLGAAIQGKTDISASSVNRIKFSIPVIFSQQ